MKTVNVAAAIIVNNQQNKILITKRQGGEFDNMWEFPGGKIEKGETNEEATIREIKEELSVDIKIKNYFTTINHQYETFYLTMHLYWAKIINGSLTLNEHKAYKWVSKSQLDDVNWIPADIQLVAQIKESNYLQ